MGDYGCVTKVGRAGRKEDGFPSFFILSFPTKWPCAFASGNPRVSHSPKAMFASSADSQPFWSELLILLPFSYLQIPGQVPPPTRSFPLCYGLEVVVCAPRATVLPLGPQRGDVRDGGTFKRQNLVGSP